MSLVATERSVISVAPPGEFLQPTARIVRAGAEVHSASSDPSVSGAAATLRDTRLFCCCACASSQSSSASNGRGASAWRRDQCA